MRFTLRCALGTALVAGMSQAVTAQQPAAAGTAVLAADLLTDLGQAEKKMMGLARAIPADKYGWRPRKLDRDATIAELEKSFAHLRTSVAATATARLGEPIKMFGQTYTVQQVWILTATHLHEHLGQLIAYSRSNGVKPPWGQGG